MPRRDTQTPPRNSEMIHRRASIEVQFGAAVADRLDALCQALGEGSNPRSCGEWYLKISWLLLRNARSVETIHS